jgi:hypothetical protein
MWFRRIFSTVKLPPELGESTPVQSRNELKVSTRALSQLNRLRLNASRYLPGHGVGLRSSTRRKPASEFREHRMYVPGDDVRFVDWKASARQEHIFIKQGEYQKDINIYILLDCSASMGWGNPPKSACALSMAAALGYSALAHGDRLMIVPFFGEVRGMDETAKAAAHLGPINGKGQFPGLINYLNSLNFRGTLDISQAVRHFSRRIAVGSGIVLLISDLLSDDPYNESKIGAALEYLPMPTWNVRIFHLLHPEELTPTLHGEYEFLDIETGKTTNYDVNQKALYSYQDMMKTWLSKIEFDCINNDAFYTMIHSDWYLDTEIIPRLRDLNVITPI